MAPRNPLKPPRPDTQHRHRTDYTPQGIAAWLGCPRCQHGHPLIITAATAHAIHNIIHAIAPGITYGAGEKPLKGGGTE